MLEQWKAAWLRHTPPWEQLVEAGRTTIGPAAGAALVVFALTLLILGRRAALPAGTLAMVAGLAVANYYRNVFPWWPETRAAGMAPVGWHWLPLLFLGSHLDGLLARSMGTPAWGGWRLRLGIGFLASLAVVPAGLNRSWPSELQWPYWPLVFFTLVVALGWYGSECVARQTPGPGVAFGLAIVAVCASLVVAHAHSARFADALSILAASLVGIGLVALFCRVDIGGALPGLAVLLPAILLVAHDETFSAVPWYAFLLAGAPPVTLGLLAIPPLSRITGFWKLAFFALLGLGPAVAALILAMQAETLPGGEEW